MPAPSDFLSVIDVNLASPSYGRVLRKVEAGSVGNEAHHMGFTDDRTKIWAAALNTSRFFLFDVAADPMNPRLIHTIDDVPQLTGLSGPHTPYAIPGRMLISMASGPDGSGPGGLAEFTNEGQFVASHQAPNHPYETVVKPELYVTNPAISSIDYSPRYALRLVHIGPDGRMKLDPFFAVDFSKAPDGPARPHDILLN
jgi:methanethiol oxidase